MPYPSPHPLQWNQQLTNGIPWKWHGNRGGPDCGVGVARRALDFLIFRYPPKFELWLTEQEWATRERTLLAIKGAEGKRLTLAQPKIVGFLG